MKRAIETKYFLKYFLNKFIRCMFARNKILSIMLKHIYNIRAITERLKKTGDNSAYHRLTQAFRGVTNIVSSDMVTEVEEVVKQEYKETRAYLARLKKQALKNEKAA